MSSADTCPLPKIKAVLREFLTDGFSSRRPVKTPVLVQGWNLGVVRQDDVGQVVHDARLNRVITLPPQAMMSVDSEAV